MCHYYGLTVKEKEQRPARIAPKYRTELKYAIPQRLRIWLTEFGTELTKQLT